MYTIPILGPKYVVVAYFGLLGSPGVVINLQALASQGIAAIIFILKYHRGVRETPQHMIGALPGDSFVVPFQVVYCNRYNP